MATDDLTFDSVLDVPLPPLPVEDDWLIKAPTIDLTIGHRLLDWSGDNVCIPSSSVDCDAPTSPQSQGDFSGSDLHSPHSSPSRDSDCDLDFRGLSCPLSDASGVVPPNMSTMDIKPEPLDSYEFHPVKAEPKTSKTPSRKRSRGETLSFTKDELLELTADSLEEVAANIQAQRPLTASEERQLKRQKRLIKNRESAQLSRLRKKVYIDELEKKVRSLTQRNSDLSRQVSTQSQSIRRLTDELEQLQALLRTSPQLNAQVAAVRGGFADSLAPNDGEMENEEDCENYQEILTQCASAARAKVNRQHAPQEVIAPSLPSKRKKSAR